MTSLIAEAAERLFAQHADGWPAFEDAGFARLFSTDPEAPLAEGLSVASIAARHAADGPFVEALIADWTLRGVEAPAGVITVAVNHDVSVQGGKLSGTASRVPWARRAAWLLSAHDETLALSSLAEAQVAQSHNLAGEARDAVRFDDVKPVWTGRGDTAALAAHAALFRAAQMSGAMGRALELAVEHAGVRRQFGKPLAQFQAVQQLIAVMIMEVTATRAAVRAAAGGGAFLAGVAKARAGEAATKVAAAAHQVLGAMGVSEAHELHRFTRRLWAWRDEWGSEHAWARDLGRRVCEGGGAALWPTLTEDPCATI